MSGSRIAEPQVQGAILRLLAGGQIWTNANIKHELGKTLPLSKADRATANFRPNEEKWYELVNNALSPSRSSSLVAQGYVETIKRGHHRLTDKGRSYLENIEAMAVAWENASAGGEAP